LKNIEIVDFYDKLPKEEFTLAEWAQFCIENPQYLTINSFQVNMLTSTLTKGINNIQNYTVPIETLKSRLDRINIIKYQKLEFKDIYDKCLISENFSYTSDDKCEYSLTYDLLTIKVEPLYQVSCVRVLARQQLSR
jgi:hypothetical protein